LLEAIVPQPQVDFIGRLPAHCCIYDIQLRI
jgi:hypothetical protein